MYNYIIYKIYVKCFLLFSFLIKLLRRAEGSPPVPRGAKKPKTQPCVQYFLRRYHCRPLLFQAVTLFCRILKNFPNLCIANNNS